MKFQVGQLVKPRSWRHRFRGGTLAMVIPTPSYGMPSPSCAWFLWLNGKSTGLNAFEDTDLFKVVSK